MPTIDKPRRLIIPGCGNHIHGVGTCGEDGHHCQPCQKEAVTMTEDTIRRLKFNPESYPPAP